MFGPMLSGTTAVILPRESLVDPQFFWHCVTEMEITHIVMIKTGMDEKWAAGGCAFSLAYMVSSFGSNRSRIESTMDWFFEDGHLQWGLTGGGSGQV